MVKRLKKIRVDIATRPAAPSDNTYNVASNVHRKINTRKQIKAQNQQFKQQRSNQARMSAMNMIINGYGPGKNPITGSFENKMFIQNAVNDPDKFFKTYAWYFNRQNWPQFRQDNRTKQQREQGQERFKANQEAEKNRKEEEVGNRVLSKVFQTVDPISHISAAYRTYNGDGSYGNMLWADDNMGIWDPIMGDHYRALVFNRNYPIISFAGNFIAGWYGFKGIGKGFNAISNSRPVLYYRLSRELNKPLQSTNFISTFSESPKVISAIQATRPVTGTMDFNAARNHLTAINNRGMWLINRTNTPFRFQNGKVVWNSKGFKPNATNDGMSRVTAHFTTTEPVTSHGYGNWNGKSETTLFPMNTVIADNGFPINIEPMDTYFYIDPKTGLVLRQEGAKIFTGNRENFNFYKNNGVDVYGSEEGFKLQEQLQELRKQREALGEDMYNYDSPKWKERENLDAKIREVEEQYDKVQRDWVRQQGSPTYDSYAELEKQTGLNSEVSKVDGITFKGRDYTYYTAPHTHFNSWYSDINTPEQAMAKFARRGNRGFIPETEYKMFEDLLRDNPQLVDSYDINILNKIIENKQDYSPHDVRRAEIIKKIKEEQPSPITTSNLQEYLNKVSKVDYYPSNEELVQLQNVLNQNSSILQNINFEYELLPLQVRKIINDIVARDGQSTGWVFNNSQKSLYKLNPTGMSDVQIKKAMPQVANKIFDYKFDNTRLQKTKLDMGWDDKALSEYEDELYRLMGPRKVSINVDDSRINPEAIMGYGKGKVYKDGTPEWEVMINRALAGDPEMLFEIYAHEIGGHLATGSVQSGREALIKLFPRTWEVIQHNAKLAEKILEPNALNKRISQPVYQQVQQMKAQGLTDSQIEELEPLIRADKQRIAYRTNEQDGQARIHTSNMYDKAYPDKAGKSINQRSLEHYFTPESIEKLKKAILSISTPIAVSIRINKSNK